VTVLFADVVHSMDIAATVGAERLREIMTALFDRCSAVVQRYGGTVDKFTADGITAVSGHRCRWKITQFAPAGVPWTFRREPKTSPLRSKRRDGVELRLRVGLNSGEVIAGEVGSRIHSYTTVGGQVGMAQRMESVAPPGGVMLSESTARLVEDEAHLGEVQLVKIKGAAALCRELLPMGQPVAFVWKYAVGVLAGALLPDEATLRDTADMWELAMRRGDELSLEAGALLHGLMLAQQTGPDRARGLDILAEAPGGSTGQRSINVFTQLIDIEFAKESARAGDFDGAIAVLREVVDSECSTGGMSGVGRAVDHPGGNTPSTRYACGPGGGWGGDRADRPGIRVLRDLVVATAGAAGPGPRR
jgi:class 3 adenylate cyclase